ncbi:copper resistance CopC family protein [Pseudarthrobacter raffinosi]|uniref:copper resistance CopC family protein n=1 Tax=Pseudarthrobacter raffinosi TaxID=2953651 RepID=UPI00208EBCBF|nr:copper resistance CopC family protein [Pseudarthrobacter sp. MDT3-28]MCO4239217.1 copper resistance protein CopC [Pseudarthrobacter sp. MDT3-28]
MPHDAGRKRARRETVLLALLLGLAATVIPAAPASAHTYLQSSDPAPDTQLPAAPTRVSLVFAEGIQAQFTKVTLAVGSGAPATLATEITEQNVVVPVPASIAGRQPEGSTEPWKITYRTVAADGHPVEGALTFAVTASAPSAPAAPQAVTQPTEPGKSSAAGAGAPAQQAVPDAPEPFPWPTVGLLSAVTLAVAGVFWLFALRAQRSGRQ